MKKRGLECTQQEQTSTLDAWVENVVLTFVKIIVNLIYPDYFKPVRFVILFVHFTFNFILRVPTYNYFNYITFTFLGLEVPPRS